MHDQRIKAASIQHGMKSKRNGVRSTERAFRLLTMHVSNFHILCENATALDEGCCIFTRRLSVLTRKRESQKTTNAALFQTSATRFRRAMLRRRHNALHKKECVFSHIFLGLTMNPARHLPRSNMSEVLVALFKEHFATHSITVFIITWAVAVVLTKPNQLFKSHLPDFFPSAISQTGARGLGHG